jgi:hypothetical protein
MRLQLAVLLACGFPGTVVAASPPALDWSARRVQVHIDTVPLGRLDVFEGARRRWLDRVRAGGVYRPDGRPLFFSARREGVQTYFTFYPFATWADLDTRASATTHTEAEVGGKAAVEDYDSGDVALVTPHHSEIWLRQTGLDLSPGGGPPLREVDARHARMELREMPVGATRDRLDAVWPEVKRLLTEAGYPLTLRAHWSLFGSGRLVFLWLSRDSVPAPLPPPVQQRLDAAAPLRETILLVRRDDLSNLPRE